MKFPPLTRQLTEKVNAISFDIRIRAIQNASNNLDELEFVDSSYITSVKYLDKEIFVDSSCEEDEFPVLLMDWIDGETMENCIAENYQDNYAMAMLCYRFLAMPKIA